MHRAEKFYFESFPLEVRRAPVVLENATLSLRRISRLVFSTHLKPSPLHVALREHHFASRSLVSFPASMVLRSRRRRSWRRDGPQAGADAVFVRLALPRLPHFYSHVGRFRMRSLGVDASARARARKWIVKSFCSSRKRPTANATSDSRSLYPDNETRRLPMAARGSSGSRAVTFASLNGYDSLRTPKLTSVHRTNGFLFASSIFRFDSFPLFFCWFFVFAWHRAKFY